MAAQYLYVPGPLPTLNALLAARGKRHRHSRGDCYNDLKQSLQERVVYCARAQSLKPATSAYFTYVLRETSRRRDPSNVLAAAVKLIEDALQKAGYIPNDGWKQVLGYAGYWTLVDDDPGVGVIISPDLVLPRDAALSCDEEKHPCRSKTPKLSPSAAASACSKPAPPLPGAGS